MVSLLQQILKAKKEEIEQSRQRISLAALKRGVARRQFPLRDFLRSLSTGKTVHCIGELKKASPVKGVFCETLDLAKTARLYEAQGIRAISVLTDAHFKGTLADLRIVKAAVSVPVMRKDFIIDEYQVYESYVAGADALLLIAAVLSRKTLGRLLALAHGLGMEALVEVHKEQELNKIDYTQARIIGINNRDLSNFTVDLATTELLVKKIPSGKIIVSESGISSRADMRFLKQLGVHAALIGEGLVNAPDIAVQIKRLLGRRL